MVKGRGELLRTKTRNELIAVGQQSAETWNVEGRPATVSTIVEIREDGSLRVVIQGFMQSKWLSALSSVALDGFYQRPAGAIEPMPDEEFYEFD